MTIPKSLQHLRNILFAVTDAHLNAELLVDMLGQMLRAIYRTVLTARTAKREHQRRKATLDIAAHVGVGQFIDAVQERQYLSVVLQESDDRLVQSRQLLIRLITARIVRRTAVEHVTATVA